jgi:hypothetical protein
MASRFRSVLAERRQICDRGPWKKGAGMSDITFMPEVPAFTAHKQRDQRRQEVETFPFFLSARTLR